MKVLYIGQYQKGSTSRMRAENLKKILFADNFEVIDINIPFLEANRFFRSLGFRYKIGPFITEINSFIISKLKGPYDLIWVDKGIYIQKETTKKLRGKTNKLVHFTPDPAFFFHKSRHFNASIPFYDFLITTKSFEVKKYEKRAGIKKKVILATQGYDKELHFPVVEFDDKKEGIVFIGHHEKEREALLSLLVDNEIKIALAGLKWDDFAEKHKNNKNFTYLGKALFHNDYVRVLSTYYFGLGLLSKWIPEKHTTRTFEIPACGTALVTEYNEEISAFYNDNEVIFFTKAADLVSKIKHFQCNLEKLKKVTENGNTRVKLNGYDYESILKRIIEQIEL